MKLSILMPVWNREEFIKECIDSILAQTYKDWELIIVDDGSTDNTINIIKSYNDNRIKIYSQSHLGIVDALNFGLSKCTGDYIARMDSDDIMLPNRLREQVKFLDTHPEYTMIVGRAGNTMKDFERGYKGFEVSINRLIPFNCICHPTVMFRKEDLENKKLIYRKEFEWIEDLDLWIRMIKSGLRIFKEPSIHALLFRKHNKRTSVVIHRKLQNERYELLKKENKC